MNSRRPVGCENIRILKLKAVKQPGKFAGFPKKRVKNYQQYFQSYCFLIYLLTYLTGKADAESIAKYSLFYGR
ncbi:MAG: hypothetical protein PHF31_04505 [Methylobacter sp.]|nr:hypothetical protein [Methylobacter sp.]